MIQKNDFKAFTTEIVSSIYKDLPAQHLFYKIEGDELIDRLYNNIPEENYEVKIAFEGGVTIQDAIECMSVVIGTYKTLKELITLFAKVVPRKHEEKEETIRNTWKEILLKENVDESVADLIISKFYTQISQYFKMK